MLEEGVYESSWWEGKYIKRGRMLGEKIIGERMIGMMIIGDNDNRKGK